MPPHFSSVVKSNCAHCRADFFTPGNLYRQRVARAGTRLFCSAQCSGASRKVDGGACLNCSKTTSRKNVKYCNNQCQKEFDFELRYQAWVLGDASGTKTAQGFRRFLRRRDGDSCSKCGISSWNDLPITIELEHRNGNSADNSPGNLCLLCPNCHSQTPTFRAKNLGNGRHSRRQRYAIGKSY